MVGLGTSRITGNQIPNRSFRIFTGTVQDMSTKDYYSLDSRKFKGQAWETNKNQI